MLRAWRNRVTPSYVVLLASEDVESIEATLELLGDPEAVVRVSNAEKYIERGDVYEERAVRALLSAPAAVRAFGSS